MSHAQVLERKTDIVPDGRTVRRILVTGATGYIGGRIIPRLLEEGYVVRCLVRDPARLGKRPWVAHVEIVQGDVLEADTLPAAVEDVDVAFYLIHSMGSEKDDFRDRDRRAADNFGRAARAAGVGRIIYLGGIRPKSDRLSEHLKSRLETGDRLRKSGVPVTEFRAGVIVGSGSLSFELIRYLTERVPVLITPRWVSTPTHPIAVRDVLDYLVTAVSLQESAGRIFEIGGRDILSYGDMFRIYARVRGLRRPIVHVPVLTPRLSSLWVGLVTPVNSRIARPLIDGLDNEIVAHDESARQLFGIVPTGYEDAVRRALDRFNRDDVETIWSGAASASSGQRTVSSKLRESEGMIRERRQLTIRASASRVFSVIQTLGGDTGWLYADWLWKVRGLLDLAVGGIGMRRSRRSYSRLRVGDTVDFWRVEAVEPERLLRLRAEMKLPGKAWLEYSIHPVSAEECELIQTAYYEPRGLVGFLYWHLFSIPHRFIFPGMLRELARRAEMREGRDAGVAGADRRPQAAVS